MDDLLDSFIEDFYPHKEIYYSIKISFANYISDFPVYIAELNNVLEKIILGEFNHDINFQTFDNFKYYAGDKLSKSDLNALKFTIQYQNHVCFFDQRQDKTIFFFHSIQSNYYLIIISLGKYKIFFIPRMIIYLTKIDYTILSPENNLSISISSIS